MKIHYAVLLGALLFCFAGGVYLNVINSQYNAVESQRVLTPQEQELASLRDPQSDTDGDGLKNWEEELYGTSKKSRDSDGDGVSDGQEVAEGRDPTLYGDIVYNAEESVVQESLHDQGFNPTAPQLDLNEIQNIFGDLQSIDDPERLQELLGVQFSSGDFDPAGFVDDEVKQALKNDLNKMATIIENSIINDEFDHVEVTSFIQGTNNSTYALERLGEANATAYTQMEALRPGLPFDLQGYAALFSAEFLNMSQSLSAIIAGGPGNVEQTIMDQWANHAEASLVFINLLGDMHSFVNAKGIEFSSTEPGYLFMFSL